MVGKRTDENIKVGANTAAAERGFKRMTAKGKAVIAAIGVASAAVAAKVAASATGLFRTQEQAEIRLRRALVATGRYSAETEKKIHDLAQEIQATGTVGDEMALNISQNLIQVGKVADENLSAATYAAIGIAKQSGRSIERVQRTVAKSLADIADENKKSIGELEQYFTSAEISKLRALKDTTGGMAAQAEAIRIL